MENPEETREKCLNEGITLPEGQTLPFCTCGKCIVKRSRKDFFTKFPYDKNLHSTYVNDYQGKSSPQILKPSEIYNKAKHSGFDNCYRGSLPTSLISTMKLDYKPFKVQIDPTKAEEQKIESIPFYGRSTNECMFPNWGNSKTGKQEKGVIPDINVPLRGNSNYKENYERYQPKFYTNRQSPIIPKPTLEFFGKFNGETIFNQSFVPINFNQPHYFSPHHVRAKDVSKGSIVSPPHVSSNLKSVYQQSFVDFKDKKCLLSEYLKTKGLKQLEI
jgi:hypothetical protein